MNIYSRETAIAEMNRLVNSAQADLERAAALGHKWDVPFEYNLTGAVDEPTWESSDYWDSSSC